MSEQAETPGTPSGTPSGSGLPPRVTRTRLYEQVAQRIAQWIEADGLGAGDRLPPERELATQLGVSRATLSQALVALEVVGVVEVRHGDGTVVTGRGSQHGVSRDPQQISDEIRAHADRLPDVLDTRDALETKLAALAALRHTPEDLASIDAALDLMQQDLDGGGRGVEGDERFHRAVTEAGHSPLLQQMMATISDLIRETRIESLSQPGRPMESLAGHRRIAQAIAAGDSAAAATAMHDHVGLVSDVALLREPT